MPRIEENALKVPPTRRRHSEIPLEPVKMGVRIRSARSKAGLSQSQLAKKLGLSRGAIAQWEINRGAPATGRLNLLAGYLGVSVEWLLLGPPPGAGSPRFGSDMAGTATAADLQLLEEARRLGVDLPQLVAEARQRRAQETGQATAEMDPSADRQDAGSHGVGVDAGGSTVGVSAGRE